MPQKQVLRVEFPLGGRSDINSYQNQPPYTTVAARNVWPLALNRRRGGARPGFTRAFSGSAIPGSIVGLGTVNYIDSNSAIVSKLVAISTFGDVYSGTSGSLSHIGTVTVPVNNVLTMCERDQKLYIATRETPAVYDPALGTVADLVATDGVAPQGCVSICTWRDRIVLSGGTTDPYGIFMSRQGEPEDWDYSEEDEGAAVDLAASFAGQIGEIVTALAPHSDSCLLIGCPTSLWMLNGDPRTGGELVNLSQSIGIVDANAWCQTPDGMLVFLSADGLYMMQAGCSSQAPPTSLSREKLPIALLNIDNRVTNTGKIVSLAYDTRWRGVHIFIADRSSSSQTAHYSYSSSGPTILHNGAYLSSSTSTSASNNVHWFLDWETKSLWEVQFDVAGYDPWSCHARKNYPSSESVVMCGCQDGYIRYFLSTATSDDEGFSRDVVTNGSAVSKVRSYVVLGPLSDDPDLSTDVRVDELELSLSATSGQVDWTMFRGNSPEEAVASITAVNEAAVGHVQAGRNPRSYPRVAGTALYLMLSSSAAWAFESCRMVLSRLGRTRV